MSKKLSDYCINITDGEHGSVIDAPNGEYYLLSNKNIISGEVIITPSDRKISEDSYKKINKRTKLEESDVLISTVGTLGKLAIVTENPNYEFQRSVGIIKCDKNKLLPQYLYYYLSLNSLQNRLINNSKGAVQKCIFINDLKELLVDIPSINLQFLQINLLSYIDKKIKLNNKINAELEKLAKTLYDYWFVQFDFPDEFGRPYKSSGGKMHCDEKCNKMIPIGWKIQNLNKNDLTQIIQPSIDKFENEKIYLPTANIQDDKIVDFSNKITFENRESRANMQPKSNSVWFAKMKNSKKILYFADYSNEYLDNLILSTGLCGLHCKDNTLEYIWNTINSEYFETKKDSLAHGATQQAVNNDDLVSIPLLIPPSDIILKFHNKTKALYYQKYINELEIQKLIELRDFLLPMLMNGQVTIQQ